MHLPMLYSSQKPLERLQCKSVTLAWLTGPTILMLFYLIPIAYLKIEPPLSRTWAWGCITLSYFMVLIGVSRVKLFENEKYIAAVWQWLFVTILFVTLDLVCVFLIGIDSRISSALLFLIVLWFYLPLRQSLLRLFSRRSRGSYQDHLANGIKLLTNYSMDRHRDAKEVWEQALKEIFNPIYIQWSDTNEPKSVVKKSGQCLSVKTSDVIPSITIEFADDGTRLFNHKDVSLIDSLLFFYTKLCHFQSAFIAGQLLERRRIGRDLHDQIGHDLLSLIYSAKDNESRMLAQNTMKRLREVISALDHNTIAIDYLLNEISNIYVPMCDLAGITPHLLFDSEHLKISFSSSVYLNVLNISREILSNILKHANAKNVWLSLEVDNDHVILRCKNDGMGFDTNNQHSGFGLHNIRERAAEINASADWIRGGNEFVLDINMKGEYFYG